MANALQAIGGPPEAPMPNGPETGAQGQGGPALTGGPGPQQPMQAQQAQPRPVPSHDHAVAALRHFHAIQDELTTLLKDPDLGKANMKSKIIDGVTKLVADRILSPGEAVNELSQVPEIPFKQRAWLLQHFVQTFAAQNQILDDHRQGTPGTGNWATEPKMAHGADDHMAMMAGVSSLYGGKRG